jgi:hypothetical protein
MSTLQARGPRAVALVALAAGLLAGCGKSEPQRGEVEGTVTFKGSAVTEGMVTFQKAGFAADAKIGPDGRYSITEAGGLPPGEYTVTVTPAVFEDRSDPTLPPGTMSEKKAPNIPEKYRREGSTPFKKTVTAGKNTIDLDMTSP